MTTLMAFFLFFQTAAPGVSFTWEGNPAADQVAGYEVLWGPLPTLLAYRRDVGLATAMPLPIGGLKVGVTYHIAVRAYNQAHVYGPSTPPIPFTLATIPPPTGQPPLVPIKKVRIGADSQ